MSRMRRTVLIIGLLLALMSAFMSASFLFVDDHRWYWAVAPLPCIVVALAAAAGGLLLGLAPRRNPRRHTWMLSFGGLLLLAWLGAAIASLSLSVPGMDYFDGFAAPVGWDTYRGDYLAGWYGIRALQLAVVAGILGGFFVNFSRERA